MALEESRIYYNFWDTKKKKKENFWKQIHDSNLRVVVSSSMTYTLQKIKQKVAQAKRQQQK